MVQRGTGISYGPHDCIDKEMFSGIETATTAGAPPWELGIVSRDDTLRGAAGRAFLAAYLEQCREHRTAGVVESGRVPDGHVAPRTVS
jgi:DNA-binding transcriptional LysR family regulator